jgi:hypothetical protein
MPLLLLERHSGPYRNKTGQAERRRKQNLHAVAQFMYLPYNDNGGRY